MTSNDEKVIAKIAILFPIKKCTNLIRDDHTFRKEFEEWYKNKYGKEYDWRKGGSKTNEQ